MKFSAPTINFFAALDEGGESGTYVIREKSGPIVYVGESHTGRLRKTAARHFQKWRGKNGGKTYLPRENYEIYAERHSPKNAVKRQNELIEKLKPRDNEIMPAEIPSREPEKNANPWDPF